MFCCTFDRWTDGQMDGWILGYSMSCHILVKEHLQFMVWFGSLTMLTKSLVMSRITARANQFGHLRLSTNAKVFLFMQDN